MHEHEGLFCKTANSGIKRLKNAAQKEKYYGPKLVGPITSWELELKLSRPHGLAGRELGRDWRQGFGPLARAFVVNATGRSGRAALLDRKKKQKQSSGGGISGNDEG